MSEINTINLNGVSYSVGMTDDVKRAVLKIAEKAIYKYNGGQGYYDDLIDALYPDASVSSISAVYTQSGTVYNTDSLDSLKSDLVVTATWSDSSQTTVPSASYSLSGSLTTGTSTVTVWYNGRTTIFNVTVSNGFMYTPDRGLLSEQDYITASFTGTNVSETIVDDYLRLYINSSAASEMNYTIEPTVCTSGTMRAKIKVNSLGNAAGSSYFRMIVGDGLKSGVGGFYQDSSDSTKIHVGYTVGSTGQSTSTDFLKSDWHDITLVYNNEKQSIIVDETTVVENANPATNSSIVHNFMRLAGTNYTACEVFIKELEFSYS